MYWETPVTDTEADAHFPTQASQATGGLDAIDNYHLHSSSYPSEQQASSYSNHQCFNPPTEHTAIVPFNQTWGLESVGQEGGRVEPYASYSSTPAADASNVSSMEDYGGNPTYNGVAAPIPLGGNSCDSTSLEVVELEAAHDTRRLLGPDDQNSIGLSKKDKTLLDQSLKRRYRLFILTTHMFPENCESGSISVNQIFTDAIPGLEFPMDAIASYCKKWFIFRQGPRIRTNLISALKATIMPVFENLVRFIDEASIRQQAYKSLGNELNFLYGVIILRNDGHIQRSQENQMALRDLPLENPCIANALVEIMALKYFSNTAVIEVPSDLDQMVTPTTIAFVAIVIKVLLDNEANNMTRKAALCDAYAKHYASYLQKIDQFTSGVSKVKASVLEILQQREDITILDNCKDKLESLPPNLVSEMWDWEKIQGRSAKFTY